MENKPQILPLFPIPLFIVKIPNQFSDIVSFLNNNELDTKVHENEFFGKRSKNSYILNEPQCLNLNKFILTQATLYGKEVLNYGYDSYKFSQSWLTLKYPNQSHTKHSHPNSLLSGVLYYGNYSQHTSAICFHNSPGYPSNIQILKPKMGENPINEFSYTTYPFYPTPGDLILFPSYLQHSVPQNKTNEVRKSLAFNIVPTEGFGNEEDLTELKFN